MTPNPRQAHMVDEVRARGSASVESLAERFGVTLQTVRRDVKLLADAGLLARFHGGARVPSSTTENIEYLQRQLLNEGAKQRIARAAAAAVPHGCSLLINIGTTTEAIARELLHHKGLRVITNNLNVAAILSGNPDCEVIVAGGIVRTRDRGIVGELTVDFIRQFRVDIGLIGISDHSKFNRPAMVEVARLDQVDKLLTDAAPPAPFPALLAQAGVGCVIA
jgi:DeoR family glycerol-3-phosphate regulon repressor